MQANPKISMILLAVLVSLFISIVNFFILDKDRMRAIKKRQKELQKEMKVHQKAGNQDKMMELNKELLSQTGEMMRHSFKPMLITLIPIIIFFSFMRSIYDTTTIADTWFWWYLLGAIIGSILWRKLLKLP